MSDIADNWGADPRSAAPGSAPVSGVGEAVPGSRTFAFGVRRLCGALSVETTRLLGPTKQLNTRLVKRGRALPPSKTLERFGGVP